MADKRISDFDSIQSNQDSDLMLVSVNGVTYNETAQTLKAYASAGTVKYDSVQNLTSAQQQQARSNIGAGSASDVTNIESDISDINDDITSLENLKATKTQLATAVSYSTTETLTGGTWIDGRPVYRKVYYKSGTLTADYELGDMPENMDIPIWFTGVEITTNNRVRTLPFVSATSSYCIGVWINKSTGKIMLDPGSSVRTAGEVYLVIEYTKTPN